MRTKKSNRLIVMFLFPICLLFIFLNSCHMDEYRFPRIPIVITSIPVSITSSSAICGGNITSDFGSKVLFRGVCWSANHNPTIADSISSDSFTFDGSGLGKYTSSLTGLASNTIYYVRAYAVNANGVGYGKTISFTTMIMPSNVKQITK